LINVVHSNSLETIKFAYYTDSVYCKVLPIVDSAIFHSFFLTTLKKSVHFDIAKKKIII